MNMLLAFAAAIGSTAFFLDLLTDVYRRGLRPHVVAYAAGVGMFGVATWAFAVGVGLGWSPAVYKIFFLFGAVLNIPFLALGSVFLVVGPRLGRAMGALLGGFTVLTSLVVLPANLHPITPEVIVPTASETFLVRGPSLFAAVGGGVGATLLIVLALVSVFRFWRRSRRVVYGNLLIVVGTFAASGAGTALAVSGRSGAFAASLFVAAALIWAGYRVASGARAVRPGTPVTRM